MITQKEFTTENSNQTQKLGQTLADELRGGEVICLSGELGAGKTTFTQGLLRGLGVEGPYTSPTFVIMKHYKNQNNNIYHLDAYRVSGNDIIDLGWKEIAGDKSNVIIVEWADRIAGIIPKDALWIEFEWKDENRRKIVFKSKI
jgi:tRNA threonylcarbamoyladenosine biosynthesis protein TsaE